MIDEPKKVKDSSKEANEGSDSKARTRREAKSEIEVNDTSSSSTKETNSQRETDDEKKVTFVVLQKNTKSLNSSDKTEDIIH